MHLQTKDFCCTRLTFSQASPRDEASGDVLRFQLCCLPYLNSNFCDLSESSASAHQSASFEESFLPLQTLSARTHNMPPDIGNISSFVIHVIAVSEEVRSASARLQSVRAPVQRPASQCIFEPKRRTRREHCTRNCRERKGANAFENVSGISVFAWPFNPSSITNRSEIDSHASDGRQTRLTSTRNADQVSLENASARRWGQMVQSWFFEIQTENLQNLHSR